MRCFVFALPLLALTGCDPVDSIEDIRSPTQQSVQGTDSFLCTYTCTLTCPNGVSAPPVQITVRELEGEVCAWFDDSPYGEHHQTFFEACAGTPTEISCTRPPVDPGRLRASAVGGNYFSGTVGP